MYKDRDGWGTYDNTLFSFVSNLTGDLGFVVSGYQYEPNGFTPYDAELTLGGPGGGSSTTDMGSNINLTIQYWNGHNYQEISNAYNFGSHTAETIGNVESGEYYTISDGSLFEQITSGAGSLEQVYSSSNVSFLNISTVLSSGTLYVNGTAHPFVGGDINITIAPGIYNLKIYNGSLLYFDINVTLSPGQNLLLNLAESLVTFTESGLPSGTGWWLNLTVHAVLPVGLESTPSLTRSYFSTTNTIMVYLHNGSFSYTVATSDQSYATATGSGSFTVAGLPITQNVAFSAVLYKVTLTESGLPSGTTWYVNLSNGQSFSSSGSTVSFSETNGTYSYTIATPDKTYSPDPSAGSFKVNGAPVSESTAFSKVLYSVTLTESGLPHGTAWSVMLGGTSYNSTTSKISFNEVNGSYLFSVTNLSSYYNLNYHISVVVNGKNVTESVEFLHYAYITGTISPGNATLTINGKVVSVNSGKFNVSVTAGNYSISASSPGYSSYSSNLSVSAGQAKNVDISLKSKTSPISPGLEYGAIGVVALAIVGSGAFLTLRRRKQ